METLGVETLPADLESRIFDFTRACRSAANVVSLYPEGHPAIRVALDRVAEAAGRTVQGASLDLLVLPEGLVVQGHRLSRPDRATLELAGLLHAHAIGRMVVHGAPEPDSWRTLLLLLARAPDEIRADGGIRHLWSVAGGPSIEIEEIDYARLLQERSGRLTTLAAAFLSALSNGSGYELGAPVPELMREVARAPEELLELAGQIRRAAPAARQEGEGLVRLAHAAALAVEDDTERLDEVFGLMASSASGLPAPGMSVFVEERGLEALRIGSSDTPSEVLKRIGPDRLGSFVARCVAEDHGASPELARVLDALAPSPDTRAAVLAIAEQELQQSELGVDPGFSQLWESVEAALGGPQSSSRPQAPGYDRELARAAASNAQVCDGFDDPPDRVEAWLATISDTALRQLDLRLLNDLLEIEHDLFRWRDILKTAVQQIETLLSVGQLDDAAALAETIGRAADTVGRTGRRVFATEALQHLGQGAFVRHVVPRLRAHGTYATARRVATALGPSVVAPIAEALAAESDPAGRRQLQDVIVGFGEPGRDAVMKLTASANWELRRTAAALLAEFGGASLPSIEALLADREPLVQREALKTIALAGDTHAYDLLVGTLEQSAAGDRRRLLAELTAQRDPRFGQLARHLWDRLARTRTLLPALTWCLETIGAAGGGDSVALLKSALYDGSWLNPIRTRRLRHAAASSLRRLNVPEARSVLEQAAASGSAGVRRAAREQLAGA